MNYLARTAVVAFYKLFQGWRKNSDYSNSDTTSQQSDSTSTSTSADSDFVPLPIGQYEVFLNFRGLDTRDNVANILYRFLTRSKIRTFRDD
ncbi:Disease resistance protein L6 [Linum grandiflorum]